MKAPLVYVLVVNWNGREYLEACFSSLLAGSYENVRFLLVDNGSRDGSADFVRERYGRDGRVEVIECGKNLGWSGGNNVGIRHAITAGAEYVFLLNNDTVTSADAIARLVETAERRPDIGALAAKMVFHDYPDLINSLGVECSIIGCGWDRGFGRLDAPRWNDPCPVIGVCGGACFLRTVALARTGLFPEDFQIYLDDLDLCLRLWNAGYEIWTCPQAVVRHKFGMTMGQSEQYRRKYYLNVRNRFRLIVRNFPWWRMPLIKPVLAYGECRAIGRAALDGEFWKVGAHVRAWASIMGYFPRAFAAHLDQWRRGLGRCRFWKLVRKDRLFFPGVELPQDGWYAQWTVNGRRVCPISTRAWKQTQGGPLRITHVNCYPRLGETDIEVRVNGVAVASLKSRDRDATVIEVSPGRIEFISKRIFYAEDTGEAADFGGWVGVEELTAHPSAKEGK